MTNVVRLPVNQYEAGRPSPYHENPPFAGSRDYEYSVSFQTLRNWAQELVDNSGLVVSILSSRVTNIVGEGLTYEPLVKDRSGKLIVELNEAIQKIHEEWSKKADVTGERTRQECERQLIWSWDQDGDVFIRRVNRKFTRDVAELPYHIQLIPASWVPGNLTGDFNGERIIHGIKKDEWDRPQSYFVDPNANDIFSGPGMFLRPDKIEEIPANQIWHLKWTKSINQTRGVTKLAPVILAISDIAEFKQSHRLAARASADLWASINRSPDFEPTATDTETSGGETKRTWNFEHLQMIDGLLTGESVNFHAPQHPNQSAVDFVREEVRAIAAATDVSFSQIAHVWDSSFAAQRLEIVDTFRKSKRDLGKFLGDFGKEALYDNVVQAARMARRLPARALRKANPSTLFDVRIQGPIMPVIDPKVDRQASELDQKNGWDSRQGIQRRLGNNPRQVDAERDDDEFLAIQQSFEEAPSTNQVPENQDDSEDGE